MANTYEYTLSGDPGAGQQIVLGALTSLGHRAVLLPDGTFSIERGSRAKTVWLGAWAGRDLHTRYQLYFAAAEAGMIATFTLNGSHGVLKGGVLGNLRTREVFALAAAAIDAATRQAGILVSVAERD